jgi:glycosyltransferase involved in cell wall biosynthesis
MTKPTVDIILPCFNPQIGWQSTVVDSFKQIELDAKTWNPRLIIVNDGSTKGINDENIAFLKSNISSLTWYSYSQNKGKGYALRYGVDKSSSDYILLTDIDFPYTHESLINVITVLITGKADLVAGERNDKYYTFTPFIRKIISKLLKSFVKNLLQLKVSDTQCGLKGMKKNLTSIFLNTTINRYLYDIEFLWLAGKKYSIYKQSVQLKENIVFSKMNTKVLLTEGINFMKLFIKTTLLKRNK